MKVAGKIVCLMVVAWLAWPVGSARAGAFADAAATLESEVAALQTTVAAQQTQITDLQNQLAAVQNSSVQALAPYVSVNTGELNGQPGPQVIFHDANVHIENGSGSTIIANGLGNLIIGYNEAPADLVAGERSGSHNLIMGREQRYPTTDSILQGWGSTANAHASAILGGDGTVVNASYSVAVGGMNNVINDNAVIVGGESNTVASGAQHSVVVGGSSNTTSGFRATVTGGASNIASGTDSSVSGGAGVQAVNTDSWAAGGLSQ